MESLLRLFKADVNERMVGLPELSMTLLLHYYLQISFTSDNFQKAFFVLLIRHCCGIVVVI